MENYNSHNGKNRDWVYNEIIDQLTIAPISAGSTRGNKFENLDVSSTTHGTPDDLNGIGDGYAKIPKGNVLTAIIKDHNAMGTIISTTITVRYGGESSIGGVLLVQAWDSANGVAFESKEYSSSSPWVTVTFTCPTVDTWKEVDDLLVKITNHDPGKPQKAYVDFIDVEVMYDDTGINIPIEVGSTGGASGPTDGGKHVARDSTGYWYVAYKNDKGAYEELIIAISDDIIPTGFSTYINVVSDDPADPGIVNSDMSISYCGIDIDNNDILHVVWTKDIAMLPEEGVYYSQCDTSLDLSMSSNWKNSDGTTIGCEEVIPNTYLSNYHPTDPDVLVDYDGNIHVAVPDDIVLYRMWNADSRTWGEIVTLSTDIEQGSVRVHQLMDSDGNLHVIWTNQPGTNEIKYAVKRASTGNWGNSVVDGGLPDIISTKPNANYPDIAIDKNGNIIVVYHSMPGGSGTAEIYYDTCTLDEGWSGATYVGNYRQPSLGLGADGNIYLACDRFIDINNDNIYHMKWDGSSWSDAELGDDSGRNDKVSMMRYGRFDTISFIYYDYSTYKIFLYKIEASDPLIATPKTIQTVPTDIHQFDEVLFQVEWTHDLGLQAYRFGWDHSGSWTYDPWITDGFWGKNVWSNVLKTVTAAPATTINWRMEVRDLSYDVWETGDQAFVVGDPGEILTLTLDAPEEFSSFHVGESFEIIGTVRTLPGTICEDVNAIAQFVPESGMNWINIQSDTAISTDDPNPIPVGTLGGYGEPTECNAPISFHKEVNFYSADNSYAGNVNPATAKIGYELLHDESDIDNLDVSDTTQGSAEQLNQPDDDSVKLRKNKNLIATMSDISQTGSITNVMIFIGHNEPNRATGFIKVDAIDSSTGVIIESIQFSPSTSYVLDSFSCTNLDSWDVVNNLQIKVTNKVNRDSFVDFIDVDISYSQFRIYRDYLNFDLSYIPSNARIDDATFSFNVNTAGGTSDIYSSDYFDTGTDDEVIYTTANDLLESGIDTSITGSKSVDVTHEIRNAFDNAQNYFSLQLRESSDDEQFRIDGSGQNAPTLTITYALPNPDSEIVRWSVAGGIPGTFQLRIQAVYSSGVATSCEPDVTIY